MAGKRAAIDHAMLSIGSAQKDQLALASLGKRVAGPLGNNLTLLISHRPTPKHSVVRRGPESRTGGRGRCCLRKRPVAATH